MSIEYIKVDDDTVKQVETMTIETIYKMADLASQESSIRQSMIAVDTASKQEIIRLTKDLEKINKIRQGAIDSGIVIPE